MPAADPGQGISAASAHEAYGRKGALPSAIKPVGSGMRVQGPAFPVLSPPGDNLWLHRAILAAQPSDILVVSTGPASEFGYWGDVMNTAAIARGLGGLVIDGGIRDVADLREAGWPVFAGNVCIVGTGKRPEGTGSLGGSIQLGGTVVQKGDLVIGDDDGVVVIAAADAERVLAAAHERQIDEARILGRLRGGETTMEIYGLPAGE